MKGSHGIWKGGFLALACGLPLVFSAQVWADPGRFGHHRDRERRTLIWVRSHADWDNRRVHCVPRRLCYTKDAAGSGQEEFVVINVPNDNGSYTPVTLRRSGGGYVGPRGEYYINLPTVEQLEPVYGLKNSA